MICILEKEYNNGSRTFEASEWRNANKYLSRIQITISQRHDCCIVGHIYEFYNSKEKEVKTYKTFDTFEFIKNQFVELGFKILHEGE